jgi:glycosyltransferase involved in cell wall biosynthesis
VPDAYDAYCAGQVAPTDVLPYFQAADVYLSCAPCDGTSVSLLEALAVGLPIIVTDHPGNRAWVQPGLNGWLWTAGDPRGFAIALVRACQLTPSEREAIRQRNRWLAEERADWDCNVEQLFRAYGTLMEQVAA